MDGKVIRIFQHTIPQIDVVRFCVISSLAICSILITALSFSRSIDFINYQLFFIPIIYAAFFYPKRGLLVAFICGIIYQAIGYYYWFPNYGALAAITSEAVIFVIIAYLITFFIEKIRDGETRYRLVFEHSQLGFVLFSRTDYTIRKTNPLFLAMLDYTPEEIKGRPFTSLCLTPRERERFLERIAKNGATENFETRLATKSGAGCWVNLSWNAIDENTISCTAININGRKIAEKMNNDNMLKYRQLTENSPNGILLIQEGTIKFSNPSFSGFSGYGRNELAGKTLDELVDPRDRDEFIEYAKHWSESKNILKEKDIRFVTKTGEVKVGALTANPILHLKKPAIMINIVDISERQRLSDKIREDNERRRGIIITVAHEMRTPLQPILGYLNLLLSDPQGFGIVEDTKKILERCLVSVDRERQIINQMLELSVLESGKLQLSYSTFPLKPLVQSILDTSGYLAKAEVTIDIPDSVALIADKERICNVIDSLLSNAVSYSKPPRKIHIFYNSENEDSQHHISVQDNGIGIEQSVFASIFEPFQLADAAKLSRRYDRIGLSLSISKKVVQMHSGDISVISAVNNGSTFTIHIPKEMKNAS
ncbi:MAG: PAS domain-containing sensor histidine kinase [Methanomicrobiales archaeon HGW-Methanomicrobiales-1]|jgi:PAS domain S-box-containing protein|nr:MAG: PAS domain-containing sensor histidine kinase [Methanomicrobiales archaeon HGW-Methanomicrobiales-1]